MCMCGGKREAETKTIIKLRHDTHGEINSPPPPPKKKKKKKKKQKEAYK